MHLAGGGGETLLENNQLRKSVSRFPYQGTRKSVQSSEETRLQFLLLTKLACLVHIILSLQICKTQVLQCHEDLHERSRRLLRPGMAGQGLLHEAVQVKTNGDAGGASLWSAETQMIPLRVPGLSEFMLTLPGFRFALALSCYALISHS